MIYIVGNAPDSSRYERRGFSDFLNWIESQKLYQLDIETTVTPHWCTKKLITLQFGDNQGQIQWVLQWSSLNSFEQAHIRKVLQDHSKLKIIHNAMFECVVLLFHGIRITNVYDTMLAEMVLYCGMQFKEEEMEDDETDIDAGFYALTSLTSRYLRFTMDKTEQTTFGDDILTESKVLYAAADVQPLSAIRRMQLLELHKLDLEYVAALENNAVLGYAEMTFHGMELDVDKWRANIDLAAPVVADAKKKLDAWLIEEPFCKKAIDMGFYDPLDRTVINWNSPAQKSAIVQHFFPFLQDKVSKPVLNRLLREYSKGKCAFSDERAMDWVQAFFDKDYQKIENAICEMDRDWLINHEMLIPGGVMSINWGSRDQALAIFRCVQPKLPDLSKQTLAKFPHPIVESLREYKDALKLISTYGEKFIEKHLEPDGKVRTSFNQIVSTGRISSRRPNMQNIPAKEAVGTRYRNAFVCRPDERYVDSDFASQELVIIAYMSGDPVWNEALKLGQDLHSVCAELVFPKQAWKHGAEADCAYYGIIDGKQAKQKCSCKAHKRMRNAVKSINFGLA